MAPEPAQAPAQAPASVPDLATVSAEGRAGIDLANKCGAAVLKVPVAQRAIKELEAVVAERLKALQTAPKEGERSPQEGQQLVDGYNKAMEEKKFFEKVLADSNRAIERLKCPKNK